MENSLVSIIIPTKNSSQYLATCLQKIKTQRYKRIEVIIVDGKSSDIHTLKELAKKYHCKVYTLIPKVKGGLFDATPKRNYGGKKAKGKFLYFLDADMEVSKNVISDAVALCNKGFDAVIIPEDSFGQGPWARAKRLERRFYWNDDTVESPRFFVKKVWEKLNGYDETIAGGGDDRDLYQKALEAGYRVGRIKSIVMDNEGSPKLWQLLKKQFMYKREVLHYLKKRPSLGIKSYFPIRESHFTNWRMFLANPLDTFYFLILKIAEIITGVFGIVYSLIKT